MKPMYLRTGGGLLLVLAGVILLLQNMNLLPANPGWVWGILFLLGGLMFIAVFITDSQHWWALFPGMPLLALGVMVSVNSLFPSTAGSFWGAFFMGMIGLAFWVVYFANRSQWWAIIPGGILMSIAVMIGLTDIFNGIELPGFLFLGMGITFLIVYFAPTPHGRQRWGIFPAIPLLLMGLAFSAFSASLWRFVWPLFLVGGGVWILWRSLRPRATSSNMTGVSVPAMPSAPTPPTAPATTASDATAEKN